MLNWTLSKDDQQVVREIAARAMVAFAHLNRPLQDWVMDVTACHNHAHRLRLSDLAGADAFTFAHDLGGIYRHLDRETGQLRDCFVPRCAARPASDALDAGGANA